MNANIRKSAFCAIILILGAFAFEVTCQAQDQQVTVMGKAAIIGNNRDAAQKKALSDAFRNAVEKGLGVWVKSQSEVKNFSLVKDEILTRAEGYVTDHEIIKEGVQDGLYFVTIKATVGVDKIGADFQKLVGRVKTQMGNPSITFVLTTWEAKGQTGRYSNTESIDASRKERVRANVEGGYDEKFASERKNSVSSDESYAGNLKVGASSRESGDGAARVYGRRTNDSIRTRAMVSGNVDADASLRSKADSSYSASASRRASGSDSYEIKADMDASRAVDSSSKVAKSGSYEKIDETLWKKYPDQTIIDAFQQEFKDKGFDLKAADQAREIALTESIARTSVDPRDRKAVREQAEKEGANYVARGEAQIIDSRRSDNTGNYEVTAKVGVEIIDVNSGDIVSSYSNTATASSKSEPNARVQAVKKVAVLGARTLADQTIQTWQERALSGRQYAVEIQNVTSMRRQKKPIMDAIESEAQITSQTSPTDSVLLIHVMYKGTKKELGDRILSQLESKPGFSEKEFDGPEDKGGKIVFKFLK